MAAIKYKIRDIDIQFIKEKAYEWLDDHLLVLLAVCFVLLGCVLVIVAEHFVHGSSTLVGLLFLVFCSWLMLRFIGC